MNGPSPLWSLPWETAATGRHYIVLVLLLRRTSGRHLPVDQRNCRRDNFWKRFSFFHNCFREFRWYSEFRDSPPVLFTVIQIKKHSVLTDVLFKGGHKAYYRCAREDFSWISFLTFTLGRLGGGSHIGIWNWKRFTRIQTASVWYFITQVCESCSALLYYRLSSVMAYVLQPTWTESSRGFGDIGFIMTCVFHFITIVCISAFHQAFEFTSIFNLRDRCFRYLSKSVYLLDYWVEGQED